MAARHIRRLQEQLEAQKAAAADEQEPQHDSEPESDERSACEDSDGSEAGGAAPFNPFDLLSDDDEEAPAASEDADEGSGASEGGGGAHAAAPPTHQQPAAGGSKKKKAKKKKAKQPHQPAADGSGSEAGAEQQAGEGGEDIDQLLRELNIAPPAAAAMAAGRGSQAGPGTAPSAARQSPLLGVDPKRIRGDVELRRMFGAGVVEAVDRLDGRRGRSGGAAASAAAAVRRRQLKRVMLVAPADYWPNVDPGISMSPQAGLSADGQPLFAYSWSPNYAAAQRVFEAAQASYDPQMVHVVLGQFPYHVDSLLAMEELYRSMGQAERADDHLGRALYALESAWPPSFDPTSGACRLDIEQPENKGLFVALFRHAQALSRRGCHGSALEVTKLLLSLDPEDPMGGLLMLDYLALRAGAYAYLDRFVAEFDASSSLALQPNYAFALPLARLRLEQQRQAAAQKQQQQQGGAGAAADEPQPHAVSSLTLLAQALLLHPLVFKELVAKLQGQGACKEAAWKSLAARRLYAKASDHGSESLGHLVRLFVERSHSLWKAPDVLAWLATAAEAAADVADGKRRAGGSSVAKAAAAAQAQAGSSSAAAAGSGTPLPPPDAVAVEGSAEDWACVARESFPPSSRNEYGHLRLADFSETVAALPQDELAGALPPEDLAAAVGRGGQPNMRALERLEDALLQQQLEQAMVQEQMAAARRGAAAPAMSEDELRAANPLLMLLQSMLPWVNAGQQPEYGADGDASGGQPLQQQQQQQQGQQEQQQPPDHQQQNGHGEGQQ